MALKKCKECGKDVSTKAKVCPSCGAPVKAQSSAGCGCLIIIIVVGGVLYLAGKDKTPEQKRADIEAQTTAQNQAQAEVDRMNELRRTTPVFSASQIIREYSANEIAADASSKNKWLKVSGTVDKVGKDILNSSYVTLRGSDETSFRTVQCFFDDSHNGELAGLSPGQEVVIFGQCDGMMGNILIKKCEIAK